MALELNIGFGRSNDYFSLIATDNTGAYNAITNPGGYGAPNPTVASFTSFDISITLPDPVTLLPAGTPITVSAYPTLPSSSGGSYSITNVALGFAADTVLIDGVYLFEVVATTGDAEFTYQRYSVFSDIVGCCIKSLTLNAFGCDCNGKNQNLVKANMWLSLLKPSVNDEGDIIASQVELCGQYNRAADIIRELQKICNNQNCKGCGGCK